MAHIALFPPGEKHSWAYCLSRYPTLNQPDPQPVPDVIGPLSVHMDTRRLHDDHAGATMFSHHMPLIITTIRKRLRQGKRALGGRKKPQRFHRRDLAIKPLDANTLPRKLAPLCRLLKGEMPRLIRLILEAQAAYEDELERYWLVCHEAVAIGLLNIEALFVTIRKYTSTWVALMCLRWALRCGWEAFMGQGRFSRAGKRWLGPLSITLKEEVELWHILVRDAEEPGPPPEPFLPLIHLWRTGNVPPPPPKDRKQPWPEGEQVRCKI
jgi:hypothetical protein